MAEHPTAPLPDHVLLRYRLGELPEARIAEVRAAVEADPTLAARLAAFDAEEEALLHRVPPRVLAAAVQERAAPPRRRSWLLVPVLAAAAALLVLVLPPTDPPAPTERSKGVAPHLVVYRQAGGGMEPLQPGDPAAAGDVLQLHYVAVGQPWGAVFSVDGAGVATLHLPTSGDQAVALQPEGTVALPASYTLDDAPDFERFFLVTGPEPFALPPVLDLALHADPALPPPLQADVFELRKVGPR